MFNTLIAQLPKYGDIKDAEGKPIFGKFVQQFTDTATGEISLGRVVSAFVPYVFGIAGIILLFYIIWGGFGIMTARGDPKAVAAAQARITTAFIGFIIIFAAYWLVQIVGSVLGIKQFGNIFQ